MKVMQRKVRILVVGWKVRRRWRVRVLRPTLPCRANSKPVSELDFMDAVLNSARQKGVPSFVVPFIADTEGIVD